MPFVTKVDLSYNRQIKELPRTNSTLSGATQLGIPFSALTSGPDYSTEVITSSATTVISTFVTTSGVTAYNWGDPAMVLGEAVLSALTPSNSGVTQDTDSVYSALTTTTIDGNNVVLTYSGVSFDLFVNEMVQIAPDTYTGETTSYILEFLSAGTLDFTGRTIWSDVKGISRTEKLIVSNNPTVGYVLTCSDPEGMVVWAPSSGGTSGGTVINTFVTGGTCSGLDMTFTNSTGGTFTVTGCTSSGGTGVDTFVTGGTIFDGNMTFTNTSGGTFNVGGFTPTPTGATIDVITTATTSAYTMTNAVDTIFMDCTSNDVTATLPTAASNSGLVLTVVRQDNSANTGTVDVGVADLVQMAPSVNVAGYSSMTFISNGINRWWIK